MSTARKLVKTADSPSLWNYSLSPGWTQETSEILRLAIIKFGCGNWKAIIESNCLPGKTRSQLNLQTQRMVGQQSIAEFKGIHLDTRVVWKDTQERHRNNPNALVKNGLIINTGNNQTKEEKDKLRRLNTKKYTLPRKQIDVVDLPVVDIEDVVAEGKGKKRRVKEKRVLAPGESEKLKARLQALRDRLSVLEKELKDRGVPLVDPASKRPRMGAVGTKATAVKRKRMAADEDEDEDAFGFNDDCFEEEEEEEIVLEEDELEYDVEDEEVEILEEELDEEEAEEQVEVVEEEAEIEGEEESGFSGEEPSTNGGEDVFYFGGESNGHHVVVAAEDEAADDFVSAVEEEDDSDFEDEPSRKKRRLVANNGANGRVNGNGLMPPKRATLQLPRPRTVRLN